MIAKCTKALDTGYEWPRVYQEGLTYSFCRVLIGYQVSELPMLDWENVPDDSVRWFSDEDFKVHFELVP